MAGESRETGTLTVSLPDELDDWLEQQALDLGVDEETLLVQLLASYRQTAEGEDLAVVEDPDGALSRDDLEPLVRDVLTDRLPELTDAVADRVAADLREELLAEVESEGAGGDTAAVEERMDDLEADYREKLDDVRQRVIQVKRDADAKADPDHDHPELLDRIETIEATLDALEDDVEAVASLDDSLDRLAQRVGRHDDRLSNLDAELDGVESDVAALRGQLEDADEERIEELAGDLDDAREKLQTVAWVVRDLRDAVQGGTASQALDRIKQQAAAEDVRRASCANCGSGVEIGLLTEPSCPHCDTTLDGVEPSERRFGFGSATLTVAAGLESGADGTDEMDQISTAREGDGR
jgi:uncharacterized protein YoxC